MFLTSHRRDHHLAGAVLFDAPETLSDVFCASLPNIWPAASRCSSRGTRRGMCSR